MTRQRALKVILVLSGVMCLAGLYPLIGALRAGATSTIVPQDQMILGIYVTLGVFLLMAARNPDEHRSFIRFAGWSTVAHDSVMIIQGVQRHTLSGDAIAFTVIAIVGLALIALSPDKDSSPALGRSMLGTAID